jgi:hypothetical protein
MAIASDMFHRPALSLSVNVLRCTEVAIATAPKPLTDPTLAARSWSLAAARAEAFTAALSFTLGERVLTVESGAFENVDKLKRREFRQSDNL